MSRPFAYAVSRWRVEKSCFPRFVWSSRAVCGDVVRCLDLNREKTLELNRTRDSSESKESHGGEWFTRTLAEVGKKPREENGSTFFEPQPFLKPCLISASCRSAALALIGLSVLAIISILQVVMLGRAKGR